MTFQMSEEVQNNAKQYDKARGISSQVAELPRKRQTHGCGMEENEAGKLALQTRCLFLNLVFKQSGFRPKSFESTPEATQAFRHGFGAEVQKVAATPI